ncbi:MAG: ribonuclease [Micropruina sp.]|nr:ribonuclease [Micropruina sp.]
MNTARQRTLLAVGLVLLLLALVIGWGLGGGNGQPTAATPETKATYATKAASAPATRTPSGLPVCTSVPAEVHDAVAAVRANGPYLRPRDDGGTFGNRERLLPAKPGGYYREYTVKAPGERFPGPRRLVTGGQSKLGAEPAVWFYTADHYESFCELHV